MTLPSSLTDSELDGVNQLLMSVGQAPVTTIDETNPDVAMAYPTLIETSREKQAFGWNFNINENYGVLPDVNGNIIVPDTWLNVALHPDPCNFGKGVAVRNNKLYELVAHTDVWTLNEKVYLDIIIFTDFSDCPQAFKEWVMSEASVTFSQRMLGDTKNYQMLAKKAQDTKAIWLQQDCEQGDYNMLEFPHGRQYRQNYGPFMSISR